MAKIKIAKIFGSFLVMLILVLAFSPLSASAVGEQFAGGNGSADSPYIIKTAEQLDAIRNDIFTAEDKHYKLANDIDLTDFLKDKPEGWEPIPELLWSTLDGDGYIIKGLWINKKTTAALNEINSGYCGGLIGIIGARSTVKNLGIILDEKGIVVEVAYTESVANNLPPSVGGIAGRIITWYSPSTVSVENCFVIGNITVTCKTGPLDEYVSGIGGIAGNVSSPDSAKINISNCYYKGDIQRIGDVHNRIYVGSIAGFVDVWRQGNTNIENCYAKGSFNRLFGRELTDNDGMLNINGCYDANKITNNMFSGWDENIWVIEDGSDPYLKAFPVVKITFPDNLFYHKEAFKSIYNISDNTANVSGDIILEPTGDGLLDPFVVSDESTIWVEGQYSIQQEVFLIGADPEINIEANTLNGKITVEVLGDETGGIPKGYVTVYINGEEASSGVLDSGTYSFKANGLLFGGTIRAEFISEEYYYPASVSANPFPTIFVIIGVAIIMVVIVIIIIVAGAAKKRKIR